MTISDKVKDTASKNRKSKFILDALNGLMDGRQFMTTLTCKGQKNASRNPWWFQFLSRDKILIYILCVANLNGIC